MKFNRPFQPESTDGALIRAFFEEFRPVDDVSSGQVAAQS